MQNFLSVWDFTDRKIYMFVILPVPNRNDTDEARKQSFLKNKLNFNGPGMKISLFSFGVGPWPMLNIFASC